VKFGPLSLAEAEGAVLAHSVRLAGVALKKGLRLEAQHIVQLREAGQETVIAAKLTADDVPEDEAAGRLARQVCGEGLRIEAPFTGRSNIFAEIDGLFVVDQPGVDRLNQVDEAVTLATLPPMRRVEAGEMVATVKIIPFAVEGATLSAAEAAAGGSLMRVAPFQHRRIGVVSTLLPGLKPSVVDKTLRTMASRLQPLGSVVGSEERTAHETGPLAAAILRQAHDNDIVVVFGASAITDRRDIIPAAVETAGGTVRHFGMPVDPGNLLLLADLDGKPVLGAPGCARSPKENGFDWVLQRLLAGLDVSARDIARLGVGGLLMEIVSRPQPRAPHAAPDPVPRITAVVLAAGRSTRMGRNKLREPLGGKAMVRHAVEAALASSAESVIVVTGHEAEQVRGALAGLLVRFVHNPAYGEGLATSLRAGLAAVPAEAGGMVVLLGDMPRVSAPLIDGLVERFRTVPKAAAVVPVAGGRRGNPVLVGRKLFPALLRLSGDAGARRLLEEAGDAVVEMPVDDDGVLIDIDTPEALAALTQPV